MQPNTLLTTLFAAAAVSGAAVQRRQANAFTVSNFTASCIPHSFYCAYDFDVITDPASVSPTGNSTPVSCGLFLPGPDYLPAVGLTGCDPAAYSWSVAVAPGGGLQLSITTPQDSHGNYTGVYDVPADQLVAEQHGAVTTQRYIGPGDFSVPIGVAVAE
ncbi:hypothetical protein GGR54DRAFT_643705 [Hypoxylon sp. NC1633]|nr:hypothetical protein GGR54DRAFT_643705 [Hypoxylon sp. NC1633]